MRGRLSLPSGKTSRPRRLAAHRTDGLGARRRRRHHDRCVRHGGVDQKAEQAEQDHEDRRRLKGSAEVDRVCLFRSMRSSNSNRSICCIGSLGRRCLRHLAIPFVTGTDPQWASWTRNAPLTSSANNPVRAHRFGRRGSTRPPLRPEVVGIVAGPRHPRLPLTTTHSQARRRIENFIFAPRGNKFPCRRDLSVNAPCPGGC